MDSSEPAQRRKRRRVIRRSRKSESPAAQRGATLRSVPGPVSAFPLPTRFRRAMVYVIEALGEVGVTKLEKILYLADLEHFHETGTTLTGARWVRYKLGPMAKAVLPSTALMDGYEISVSSKRTGPYDSRVYTPGPSPRFRPDLTREERDSLDRILAVTGSLTAKEAIDLAYSTGPMRFIEMLEKRKGRQLLDVELTFEIGDAHLAAAATIEATRTEAERAAFKGAEFDRIRDLQDAVLAAASG